MSTLAQSLNLRPQEKRILAVIAFIVFVVLNVVLVFPQFKEYQIIKSQLEGTRGDITKYQRTIDWDTRPGGLKDQLEALQRSKGGLATTNAVSLQQTINDEGKDSGVFIQSMSNPTKIPMDSTSDRFFESKSIHIAVDATEDSLVKFLYNIGNDPAMIRVRELEMHPKDGNRYRLLASITLTADYQKTNSTRKAAPILTGTETAAKTNTKAPTNALPAPAARGSSTNANTNTAPARRTVPRAGTPPVPTPPAPTPPAPPAPSRAVTPPVPGQTNAPAIPPRPPRTP
jgi:hypothetical protein